MSHNNFVLCKAMSHNALFCVPALCFFLLIMVCCLPYYWLLLTFFLCLDGFDFILNWLITSHVHAFYLLCPVLYCMHHASIIWYMSLFTLLLYFYSIYLPFYKTICFCYFIFFYSYKNQPDYSQGCFGNGLDELNLNPHVTLMIRKESLS